jgi:hypothetical protein
MTKTKQQTPDALYTKAVEFIAMNDEPGIDNRETIANMMTTVLVAETFGKTPREVADAIGAVRRGKAVSTVTYVARGPMCWGRADDVDTAVKNAKKSAPRIYLTPGQAYSVDVYRITGEFIGVDGMGSISYRGTCEHIATETLIVRKR